MKKNQSQRKNRLSSFTLLEIVLVVSLLVLLASLAIPGLLRSRLNANENIALRNLRTVGDAAVMYRAAHTGYPADLNALSATQPPYLDQAMSSGVRAGYLFSLAGGSQTFSATATPQEYSITGARSFFIDETGVIRLTDQDTTATALDQPIS